MNNYKYSAILALLISLTGNATEIKKEINIPLKRIQCYGNLIQVVMQIDGRDIDFNKFPEHIGFRKCEDSLKAAENYTDHQGRLSGEMITKISIVNEVRCVGGQWGACWELPVKLQQKKYRVITNFFGDFNYPDHRAYHKYISGCHNDSKYKRCY
jgi:hypothetical protein